MDSAMRFPEPSLTRNELLASLLLKFEELRDSMKELKRSTEDWVQGASSTSQSSSVCDAEHVVAVATLPTAATTSTEISTAFTESTPSSPVLPQVAMDIDANLLAVSSSTAMAPARCSMKCEVDVVDNNLKSKASTECKSAAHVPDHSLAASASPAMDVVPSYINAGTPTNCSTKCLSFVDVATTSAGVPVTALAASPTTSSDVLSLSFTLSRALHWLHANMDTLQVFDEVSKSPSHNYIVPMLVPLAFTQKSVPVFACILGTDRAVLVMVETLKGMEWQPWTPPIPLEILYVNTKIRPLPWPSFNYYHGWCSQSCHPSTCKWELNSEVTEQRPPWPPPPVSVRRQEEKPTMLMRSTRDCWSYIECDLLRWFDCELITTGVGMVDLKPWPPPICSGSVVGSQLVCTENMDSKGAWIFLVSPWSTHYGTNGDVVDFSLVVELSQEQYVVYNVDMQSIVLKLLVVGMVFYSCYNKYQIYNESGEQVIAKVDTLVRTILWKYWGSNG